ncbi:MAG: tripartite tricarboxylate transporter TctB family protein [Clostridia bacterium]|nr:tripartite tricarboxylate transporter TctB family protein [Clostridia bacterium]
MKKYLTGEKLVNLFLLALSVFYLSYSVTHYKIGTMRVPKEGFLPLLLGIGMVCLSGFLFIQSLAGKGDAKNVQLKLPWLRFAGMIAASFAYAMLLNTLGYCICTFLFLLAVLKLAKLEGWKLPLIIALVCAAAFYLLFKVALGVMLPAGILGF